MASHTARCDSLPLQTGSTPCPPQEEWDEEEEPEGFVLEGAVPAASAEGARKLISACIRTQHFAQVSDLPPACCGPC